MYTEYKVTTTYREFIQPSGQLNFPAITFCNMGKFFNPMNMMGRYDVLRSWGMDPAFREYNQDIISHIISAWTEDADTHATVPDNSYKLSQYNYSFSGFLDKWGYSRGVKYIYTPGFLP